MRAHPLPSLLWLLLLVVAGCGSGRPAEPGPVRLTLNWFPEVEHAGIYAAQQHGFFREEGVVVEVQAGRPEAPVLSQVATGRIDLGVGDASEVLQARAQGLPVVAVAASLQHNPRCIMVRADSGITELAQLRDLELAMNAREAFAQILQRRVALRGVTVVPYAGSVAPFLANERYAQQAYVFSEPFVAQERGVEVRCLMTSALGFDPYASVLVAREQDLRERPERLGKAVRAILRGWRRYREEPGPTNGVLRDANPEVSAEALDYGANAIRDLLGPSEGIGQMTEARWTALRDAMAAADLVPEDLDVSAAFPTRFLTDP